MWNVFSKKFHIALLLADLFTGNFDCRTDLQIGCGDLFENTVVDQFNECAVTRKGCVPQKPDEGRFPVPAPAALVPEFDTTRFTGTWYITSGLNKTFDTFDCQKHDFSAKPRKLTGPWLDMLVSIISPRSVDCLNSARMQFLNLLHSRPGVAHVHRVHYLVHIEIHVF